MSKITVRTTAFLKSLWLLLDPQVDRWSFDVSIMCLVLHQHRFYRSAHLSIFENMRSFLLILVVCAPVAVSAADCTTDEVAIITSTATWASNVLQGPGTYNSNDAGGESLICACVLKFPELILLLTAQFFHSSSSNLRKFLEGVCGVVDSEWIKLKSACSITVVSGPDTASFEKNSAGKVLVLDSILLDKIVLFPFFCPS